MLETVAYLDRATGARGASGRYLDALEAVLHNLGSMPLSYPRVTDERLAGRGYRKASFLSHVLVFRVLDGGVVEVSRVFHGRQDYARLL